MWTGLLGQEIPDTGDPEYAKKLIAESGEPMPTIQFDYGDTPERNKEAASIGRLARPRPASRSSRTRSRSVSTTRSSSTRTRPASSCAAGWGPDWPNASTVIPALFTPAGGFNLSQVDDKAFNAKVAGGARPTPTAPLSPSSGRS